MRGTPRGGEAIYREASEPKARLMHGPIREFWEAATRGRARFCDFLEAATRPLDGFVGAF